MRRQGGEPSSASGQAGILTVPSPYPRIRGVALAAVIAISFAGLFGLVANAESERVAAPVGWQNEVALVATAIADRYPSSFIRSEITSDDPAIVTFRFKGDVPDGLDRFLAEVPPGVKVELVGGYPLSAVEIDEAIVAAHQAVWATGEFESLQAEYDLETSTVRVSGSLRSGDGHQPTVDEILAALPADVRDGISLTLFEEPVGPDE